VHGIKLSRNRGHQNALLAGLFSVEGDALVSVDADLQGDVTVIEEMVKHFSAGCEIVYGVGNSRSSDTLFALRGYTEVNLFLRGVVPLLGYRTSTVYYDRAERFAGVSKYRLSECWLLPSTALRPSAWCP